jgi:kynureninase
MQYENTLAFAKSLDKKDTLRQFRSEYFIPKKNGKELIYFCGNSLGLQPKVTEKFIKAELDDWRIHGVEGHFNAKKPWLGYHHQFEKPLMNLLGAKKGEVVAMNQLTVNLNLMLISFYRPDKKKKKIILEANAFPSDYYAAEQIIRLRGGNPKKDLLELPLRKGESTHRTKDILDFIEQHKNETALIMLGAVNYYSGQFFDIAAISKKAKQCGIIIGLDLAHAIGNLPLQLHKWDIDFATWCSYKYLNSGPGGVSGVFVHQKHANESKIDRFGGWWGNDEKTRFKMLKHFEPSSGAQGWQLSNAPVLSMAAHAAALSVFEKTSMKELRAKSVLLSGYLRFLLQQNTASHFNIITPENPNERGCQVSIQMKNNGRKVFEILEQHGVIADWREPDVIRVAPVSMYNTFEDVYRFSVLFSDAIKQVS